jgi:transmembrane sensor
MDDKQVKELLDKYNAGRCSNEEKAWLETWYLEHNQELPHGLSEQHIEQATDNIWMRLDEPKTRGHLIPMIIRYAAAASIIIAVSAGGYFVLHKPQPKQQTAQFIENDIKPGHNQATLTLANGQKIVLIQGLKGRLAVQNSTVISAMHNTITYAANKSGDKFSYNTLTTARGEQSPLPLVLADGTKVWLNAESSITFPTAFNRKERIVKVTGEVLFEVAHNVRQPFKVQTEKQTIEDIGTTFDVNAYADEAFTKTTLVEGSVKVNGITLKPNEQTDGNHIKTVNAKSYTAWKNGDFDFEDENIQSIMRQLSRWYNIEVIYEGNITSDGLTAQITRNRNISGILHILQNTQTVKFKIEGRRVTVIE